MDFIFSPEGLSFHLCNKRIIHIHITIEIQKCTALCILFLTSVGQGRFIYKLRVSSLHSELAFITFPFLLDPR